MLALDKEKIIKSLQDLPDKTTIEDAMERLYLLAKIEKGIEQADKGQFISPYVQCPECNKIIYNTTDNLDVPASCCGAKGGIRTIWPSLEFHKFFEIVETQDLDTEKGCRIAGIFLCTVLELLLEDALWQLLEIHTNFLQLAEFVLDSNRGKHRRVQLYNELSGQSLENLLQINGMGDFLKRWNELVKIRNGIVHGRYFVDVNNGKSLIQDISKECLKVFSLIINDIQDRKPKSSII